MTRESVAQRRARLRELANRVWEEPDAAEAFLTSPHALLEGQSPLQAARTVAGTRRVEHILNRLEHSLPV